MNSVPEVETFTRAVSGTQCRAPEYAPTALEMTLLLRSEGPQCSDIEDLGEPVHLSGLLPVRK